MKILLIDHAKKHFKEQDGGYRWQYLPLLFEKKGHKVLHVTKKDWKFFYFKYLKFKPNVIITSGLIASIPCMFKKLGLIRKPIVNDWNDYYVDFMGKNYGIAKVSFFENYGIENADYITTPSKFLYEKCINYGKKVQYIPHGVDVNTKVKPVKLKGNFKIIYTGAQTEYKRVDRIIKAVKGLNCDLYLIGEVNEKLKKIAPSNVHFLGYIKHKDIGSYIKAADLCVIPADQENLKTHVYAKFGKPILAYKGLIQYFLTHKENAYITTDFRKGIKELINNDKLLKKITKGIKTFSVYSWDEVANQYLKFLKEVVKNEQV